MEQTFYKGRVFSPITRKDFLLYNLTMQETGQKATIQQYNLNIPASNLPQTANAAHTERQTSGLHIDAQEVARSAERARLRQGIMHVRIRHFYFTLAEVFDPTLHSQPFVVGTGTGRPTDTRRVIAVSP